MKKYKYIIGVMAIALLSSCMITGPAVSSNAMVTKNAIGSKTGVAERTIWFGIWLGDTDLSITKAAKKGRITKIATVDREEYVGFLGIKRVYKTIVTGESSDDDMDDKKKKKSKKGKRSRSRK